MFTQQIFTQTNFRKLFFFTESVRLSFVDLRWAQLYVSLVFPCFWLLPYVIICLPRYIVGQVRKRTNQCWTDNLSQPVVVEPSFPAFLHYKSYKSTTFLSFNWISYKSRTDFYPLLYWTMAFIQPFKSSFSLSSP